MKNAKSLDEIFATLKLGDKNALVFLYHDYYAKMFSIAFSVTKNEKMSEDVVQNTIYKFLVMDKNLYPSSNVNTWLSSVIKNEALALLRKEKRTVPIEQIENLSIEPENINDYVEMDEFYSIIKNLSEDRQEVVSLKIIGGYTHKEISRLLGKPIGTIQWLYNTSIKSLRVMLSSLFGIIIALFSLSLFESILYIQNIISPNENSGIGKPFYFDYALFILLASLLIITIVFIVVYKKNHKTPTKIIRKRI